MKKEPVAFWSLIAAIIVGLLGRAGIDWIDGTMVEGVLQALAVIVTAYMARRKTMPVATINEAGLTTGEVKMRAASPVFAPVSE